MKRKPDSYPWHGPEMIGAWLLYALIVVVSVCWIMGMFGGQR